MQQYDAIVVGGGPAGASCAIWLSRLGLAPLLIEAGDSLGGLERTNPFVDNWLAVLPGLTGQQVAENICRSVALADVPVRCRSRVRYLQAADDVFIVRHDSDSGEIESCARFVVIASGTGARSLPGQPHGEHFSGVLIGPGVHITEQDYRGKSVAILGGGDNAFENYAYVRERGAAEVHIYARSIRAQNQWVERACAADVHLGPHAVEPGAKRVNGQQYDFVLVFYGWEPRAPYAEHLDLARDAAGYFSTDFRTTETSVSGIYAIGEIAHRMHPCVATAMADGVVAAKAIEARLQACRPGFKR